MHFAYHSVVSKMANFQKSAKSLPLFIYFSIMTLCVTSAGIVMRYKKHNQKFINIHPNISGIVTHAIGKENENKYCANILVVILISTHISLIIVITNFHINDEVNIIPHNHMRQLITPHDKELPKIQFHTSSTLRDLSV